MEAMRLELANFVYRSKIEVQEKVGVLLRASEPEETGQRLPFRRGR